MIKKIFIVTYLVEGEKKVAEIASGSEKGAIKNLLEKLTAPYLPRKSIEIVSAEHEDCLQINMF